MSSQDDLIGELESYLSTCSPAPRGASHSNPQITSMSTMSISQSPGKSEQSPSSGGHSFPEKRKMEESGSSADFLSNPAKVQKMDNLASVLGVVKEETVDPIMRRTGSMGNLSRNMGGTNSLMNMSGGTLQMEIKPDVKQEIKTEVHGNNATGFKIDPNFSQVKQEQEGGSGYEQLSGSSVMSPSTPEGLHGGPGSTPPRDIAGNDQQKASTAARIRGALESSGLAGNLTPEDMQTLKRLNEIAKSSILSQEQKSSEASQLLKNNPTVSRLLLKLRTEKNIQTNRRFPSMEMGPDGPVGTVPSSQGVGQQLGPGSYTNGRNGGPVGPGGPPSYSPQSGYSYQQGSPSQGSQWSNGPGCYRGPGMSPMGRGEGPPGEQRVMLEMSYMGGAGGQMRMHPNQGGDLGPGGYPGMAPMRGGPGGPVGYIGGHGMGSPMHGGIGPRMVERGPGTMYLNRQTGQMMYPDNMIGTGMRPGPPMYPGSGVGGSPHHMSGAGPRRGFQQGQPTTMMRGRGGMPSTHSTHMDHSGPGSPYHGSMYERGGPYGGGPGDYRSDHNLLTSKFPGSPGGLPPPQTESQLRARLSQQPSINTTASHGSELANRLMQAKGMDSPGFGVGGGMGGYGSQGASGGSGGPATGQQDGISLFEEINNSHFGHFNTLDSVEDPRPSQQQQQHNYNFEQPDFLDPGHPINSWKGSPGTVGLRSTLLKKLTTAVESSPNIPTSEASRMAADIENKAFFNADAEEVYVNNVAVQLAKIFSQSKSSIGSNEGNNMPDSTSTWQGEQAGPSSTTSNDHSSSTANANNSTTVSQDNSHFQTDTTLNCFQESLENPDLTGLMVDSSSPRLDPNFQAPKGEVGPPTSHQATNVIVSRGHRRLSGKTNGGSGNQPQSVDSGIGSPRSIPGTGSLYSPNPTQGSSSATSSKGGQGTSPSGLGVSTGSSNGSPSEK